MIPVLQQPKTAQRMIPVHSFGVGVARTAWTFGVDEESCGV